MAVRAENDPRYSRRFLFMGLAAIGFALWSLYDGAVGYHNQRERALAHKELEDENKGRGPGRLSRQVARVRPRPRLAYRVPRRAEKRSRHHHAVRDGRDRWV